MIFEALLSSCLVAVSQGNSMAGSWTGHLFTDMPTVMARVSTPEHKRLILYTLNRLKKSSYLLSLNSDGSYEYHFDDGFRPDGEWRRGNWSIQANSVVLTSFVDGSGPVMCPLMDHGQRFRAPFHHAKGVMVEFSRSRG